jgi:hypothetical protein
MVLAFWSSVLIAGMQRPDMGSSVVQGMVR